MFGGGGRGGDIIYTIKWTGGIIDDVKIEGVLSFHASILEFCGNFLLFLLIQFNNVTTQIKYISREHCRTRNIS